MAQRQVDREALDGLLKEARRLDNPHVDVAPLLGLDTPMLLGVNDLHSALGHVALGSSSLPALSLKWDDKEVTVEHIEGGAMAKLAFRF